MFLPDKHCVSTTDTSFPPNARLYCAKCAEKSKYKIPDKEIMPLKRNFALLQKKKLDELMDIYSAIVTNVSIINIGDNVETVETVETINKKIRKSDRINEIETILKRDYLETIDDNKYDAHFSNSNNSTLAPKNKNYAAHDLDLITYGRNLMKHMDAILYSNNTTNTNHILTSSGNNETQTFLPIDMMIIENQISTIASRMKTLQGMITQYFIMKHVPHIEFISASCKLKLFTDSMSDISIDASSYSDRKKSGIAICRYLGKINYIIPTSDSNETAGADSACVLCAGKFYAKWMPMFEQHKKKDDLADCFLQCLWKVNSLLGG
jgi:hypothetical protein